jgi:hypothetical protein
MNTHMPTPETGEDAIPQGLPGSLQGGHEATEFGPRPLVIGAIGLVVVVLVCQVGLWMWMGAFKRDEQRVNAMFPGRHALDVEEFPQPRLQESPSVDTVATLREERARVSSYGWIDQKAGIARIPVDRAMDILVQKGLPKVAARPRTPGAPPNTSIPPARKREEAGPEEEQAVRKKDEPTSAPEKKDEQPRPESKQGGKP